MKLSKISLLFMILVWIVSCTGNGTMPESIPMPEIVDLDDTTPTPTPTPTASPNPTPNPTPTPTPTPVADSDDDGDGFGNNVDCNDNYESVNPGAIERCNGMDDDCDGGIDEGLTTCIAISTTDNDDDGFLVSQGDCDDLDDSINPKASEVYDLVDNNCNGKIDENYRWYKDVDNDKFGVESDRKTAETKPEGYALQYGDCNDNNNAVHPGATEASEADAIDNDCGGKTSTDPHVGYATSVEGQTIQSAIDAMTGDQTVWVSGADVVGTIREYVENITIPNNNAKSFTIKSSRGEFNTTITASDPAKSVFSSVSSMGTVVLDGFTITGSTHGGVSLEYSSPTLTNVTISGNSSDFGGGMFLDNSSPTLTNVTITGNSAGGTGGGMDLNSSSPTLTNVTISGNSSDFGGGMWLGDSSPTLTNVTISGNSAASYGGGMRLRESSSPMLTNVTISGNSADSGGGMALYSSSPTLTNVTISGNSADLGGGGMYLWNSVQNSADPSNPIITNSIIAYNLGYNIYNEDITNNIPVITYSNLYDPDPNKNTNSDPEPKFMGYDTDGIPTDVHLAEGSPCINTGNPDPKYNDVNGSRNDMGAYGGPFGNW